MDASTGIKVGQLVVTSDGDELGRVKEIDSECFKVDAPFRIDFWLGKDAVEDTSLGVVRLNVPKDAFNQRAYRDQAHKGLHIHVVSEENPTHQPGETS
jgi:hypothetical protein